MSKTKIIGWGMTKTEKDREDIKLLFGEQKNREVCDGHVAEPIPTGDTTRSCKRPDNPKI